MSAEATCTMPAVARCPDGTAIYSTVPCGRCHRVIMAIPGRPGVVVQLVESNAFRRGIGRVVVCPRCRVLNEIIERAPSSDLT